MTTNKLGTHQMGTILFFLTRSCFSLFGYQFLLKEAGSDLIVAFLIASIITSILAYFILKWRKKKNVILRFSKKASRWTLFILLFLFFCFYGRETAYLIQKEFTEIPIFFLFLILLFTSYLLTKKGFVSLSSTSFLLFYLFLFFYITLLFGGISIVNLDYLNPIFIAEKGVLFKSIFFSILFLIPSLLFLLVLPRDQLDQKKKQEKTLFSYFFFGCLSILLEIFLMDLTLGSKLIAFYQYPLFALASRISSFLILDRLFFLFTFYLLIDSTLLLSTLFEGMRLLLFKKNS